MWWTPTLPAVRKAYHSPLPAFKRERHESSLVISARAGRSSYFKAIKKAKRDPWCEFLSTATPHRVWTARRFAKGRPTLVSRNCPGPQTGLSSTRPC